MKRKIIKQTSNEKGAPEAEVPVRKKALKLWCKYNVVVGYVVAVATVIIFLTVWSFDKMFFALSFLAALSFLLRLRWANVPIESMNVVTMWSIFCFGLMGIIMNVLSLEENHSIGVVVAGFVFVYLYSYIPLISFYLHFTDVMEGLDTDAKETNYNGCLVSMMIMCVMLFSAALHDIDIRKYKEDLRLEQALSTQPFVPVKLIGIESYEGTTLYILEAKGEKFYVSPFEYPDVRNIHSDSEARFILGDISSVYRLKAVQKIEFKN